MSRIPCEKEEASRHGVTANDSDEDEWETWVLGKCKRVGSKKLTRVTHYRYGFTMSV